MAKDNKDFVVGFISTKKIVNSNENNNNNGDDFLYLTPGVSLAESGDNLGQQYNSPDHVIGTLGSDVINVGRGIYKSKDIPAEANRYREAGWKAYENSLLN